MITNRLDAELETVCSYQDVMTIMRHEFARLNIIEWTFAFQIVEDFKLPPCIIFTTQNLSWIEHYLENGYINHDPIIFNTTDSAKPLFWRAESDWSSFGQNTVQLMKDVLAWGYWGGVSIPIYTKDGTRGFFSFVCENHDDECFNKAVLSAFISRYFHHHIMRIWQKLHPEQISLRAILTPREIEIMVGVTEGFTSQEIANQLNLSRRTVEGHMASVQNKLQAENRLQAVCKAINLGLLLPGPATALDNAKWIINSTNAAIS